MLAAEKASATSDLHAGVYWLRADEIKKQRILLRDQLLLFEFSSDLPLTRFSDFIFEAFNHWDNYLTVTASTPSRSWSVKQVNTSSNRTNFLQS